MERGVRSRQHLTPTRNVLCFQATTKITTATKEGLRRSSRPVAEAAAKPMERISQRLLLRVRPHPRDSLILHFCLAFILRQRDCNTSITSLTRRQRRRLRRQRQPPAAVAVVPRVPRARSSTRCCSTIWHWRPSSTRGTLSWPRPTRTSTLPLSWPRTGSAGRTGSPLIRPLAPVQPVDHLLDRQQLIDRRRRLG